MATDELLLRPSREPDFAAESGAFAHLAAELTSHPARLLQNLADCAVHLGLGESAGVSILTEVKSEAVFRWEAAAGPLSRYLGGTVPRDHSPCGLVLERNAIVLLREPRRCFSELWASDPHVEEALLFPLRVGGEPVGTVWIVAHSGEARFDAEDARQLERLATFASAGYQLTTALALAEGASRSKSELLAVMSHELRTPLTSVVAYADLLESEVLGPVTAKQKEALCRIRGGSWHLVSIIDEVLTLARADSGKETVHWADVDVAHVTREVFSMFEPMVARDMIRLRLEGANEPLMARTDPVKTRQVLTNLIGNAVKFTRHGEIRVVVDRSRGEDLAIHVHDTGPGVPPDEQERVFEPYAQGDMPHGQPGSGLGLAISRKLARLIGGDVTLESRPPEGCTFTLRLPCQSPEQGGGATS